jgi:hypothetical protein
VLDGWPVGERKQAVIKWDYVLEFHSYSVNLGVEIQVLYRLFVKYIAAFRGMSSAQRHCRVCVIMGPRVLLLSTYGPYY